jgi:hypothetical protein
LNQNPFTPSLLPYIEPKRVGFFIDLTGEARLPHTAKTRKRFPFSRLNDSSPLTSLLRADIVSDGGSCVQPVFLLVQKDNYRFQPSELRPLTNSDIEASWQQAHLFFSAQEAKQTDPDALSQSLIQLGNADAADGRRSAFQSLFFCSHRHLFFHPPCPRCGRPLSLCKDETLLAGQGLEAYASSLRRYLHCSTCPATMEGNGFFGLTLNTADPPGVQDCSGLIAAWRRLLASGVPLNEFPCTTCPEKETCHGPDNLSAARITPFGFYPFHMLVVKAMTLSAADFLALVAGANSEELETHLRKANVPARLANFQEQKHRFDRNDFFFFAGTDNHFLEVLYLKLSFLYEIAACINTRQTPLDMHAALECLWVNIPTQNRLLPALWNFSAAYFDIGLTDRVSAALPVLLPGQATYLLGVIWFYVLLANRMQSAADIIAALSKISASPNTLNQPSPNDPLNQKSPVFSPENIFWSPDAQRLKHLPAQWRAMWENSLSLGRALLTLDRQEAADWSSSRLQQDIDALRNEIKRALFTVTAAPKPTEAVPGENQAIHEILMRIIQKEAAFNKPASSATPIEDEPEAETIMIRGTAGQDTPRETIAPSSDSREEELAETVILSKGTPVHPQPRETVIPNHIHREEALAETIVLSPTGGKNQPERIIDASPDELPETIIISRSSSADKKASNPAPPPEMNNTGPDDGDDILSETVILRPPQK